MLGAEARPRRTVRVAPFAAGLGSVGHTSTKPRSSAYGSGVILVPDEFIRLRSRRGLGTERRHDRTKRHHPVTRSRHPNMTSGHPNMMSGHPRMTFDGEKKA